MFPNAPLRTRFPFLAKTGYRLEVRGKTFARPCARQARWADYYYCYYYNYNHNHNHNYYYYYYHYNNNNDDDDHDIDDDNDCYHDHNDD